MGWILIISMLIRLAALGWSLVLLRRVRDWRMAGLALMLALMALHQALTLAKNPSWEFSPARAASEWPVLLVSVMAFLAVVLLGRLLAEQKRIHAREAGLGQILEDSLNEIYTFDAATLRFIIVNRGARENLGYSMDELRAMTPLDLKPAFTQDAFEALLHPLRTGEQRQIEFTTVHRRKDGSLYPVEVHLQLSAFASSPAFVAVVLDVTERRRAEEALRRYARRLEGLHAIDQALLAAQAPRAIAELALPHVRGLLPCQRVSVILLDTDARRATVLHTLAEDTTTLDTGAVVPAADFGAFQAILDRQVVHIPNLREVDLPAVFRPLLGEGWRSMLRVPMCVQERVIGSLNVAARQPHAFDREHIDIAREVADQLAVALHSVRLFEELSAAHERLEQLSRRLVEIQETERRHIAMELHDEVGQMLTALMLVLNFAAEQAPDEARSHLQEAEGIIADLMERVRDLSLELRPAMLDDLGLLQALRWYFKRYTAQTGIAVDFEQAGLDGRRFPADVETAAYRIVQEALTNVARHAGVPKVCISGRVGADGLHLRITDRGAGFDAGPTPEAHATGGLSGMRERAALVGGRLAITSAPGEGVEVRVVFPTARKG